jgi:MerR family transcriptional regulator, thiopeptide resistance regulator
VRQKVDADAGWVVIKVKLRVGELAKRTGVSVRTLHHYEAVGLLAPVARTGAGYRLYGEADVARLQQIRSLRQLGFGLDRIRELLDQRNYSPLQVIELHLAQLREQIATRQHLVGRLEGVAATLRLNDVVSLDDMLTTIEEMTRVESYYTPEQLAELDERRNQLGEAGMRQAEADWATLIEEVKTEFANGTDPTSDRVRTLAARWQALIQGFTGGNPEIATSLHRMWQQEESIQGHVTAKMRQLGDYLAKAQNHTSSASG